MAVLFSFHPIGGESWEHMIEFRNVSKTYPNGTKGLNHINLTIQEGEMVVIVGLSGAGKSTLLRSINRLHDITSGDIIVGGRSVTSAGSSELRRIRRDIGMIFQSFNLVKRSTVLRNVLSGRVGYHSTLRTILGLFPKEDVELALTALERVNIREKPTAGQMNCPVANSSAYPSPALWRRRLKSFWRTSLSRRWIR